ncbi:MAG: hypothetical protein LBM08_07255, partial [Dysgonamonadaceae bacterium]|jgi:Ca2+-transporting ATPase|nr:hypothetical protein [Dysgonamonadaceae bacterium]
LFGQLLIVTVGGEMFNVTSLKIIDWGIIIGITSIVLWVGEFNKFLKWKNLFRLQAHRLQK